MSASFAAAAVLTWGLPVIGQTMVTASENATWSMVQSPESEPERSSPTAAGVDWETGTGKNYLIPALDIVGFDALVNGVNRYLLNEPDYRSNFASIRHNLRAKWVVDNDPFSVNQFAHPYQGSMYHGFARSAGLSYWESAGYTFAGSLLWETAGEVTKPSKNDQVASGIAGSFLGESLFRMASLVLERADVPRFWRELGAGAISPSTGFNRLVFDDRFANVFSSHDAAVFSRVQTGAMFAVVTERGVSGTLARNEAMVDFAMEYGLPGKPGYSYTRPFDNFAFEASASSANGIENIMTRGLLVGKDYTAAGGDYRGVWGLYGSYAYIAPQIFRVSTTAVSLGTAAQWRLTDSIALQGTGLLGLGYGAAGTIHGVGERDYHYGATPQALLALRAIFGDRALLDISAREYYVSRVASTENRGWENIVRAESSFIWRLKGRHALALKHLYTRRDANYPDLGARTQARGTVGLFYTYLSDTDLGKVSW